MLDAYSRISLKKRAGEGMGAWGKDYKNAFPSERPGPLAPAATEWRPQAVPVATKEAAGIDSRDEGFLLPQQSTASNNAPYRKAFRMLP